MCHRQLFRNDKPAEHQFKSGETILVKQADDSDYVERVFVVYDGGYYHCRSGEGHASLRPWAFAEPKPTRRKAFVPSGVVFHDYGKIAYDPETGKKLGPIVGYVSIVTSHNHGFLVCCFNGLKCINDVLVEIETDQPVTLVDYIGRPVVKSNE